MTLLQDIFSMFHDKKGPVKLGQCGEKVRLISDHGNVLVVEGKNGKFTVPKNQITNP
jgi:hypothetical protein